MATISGKIETPNTNTTNGKAETKTETKSEFPFPSFDPMAAWHASQQAWQKMFADAQGKAETLAHEYVELEAQMYARANAAIDQWAQLAHDALAYTAQLSAQARKLSFEAARKMGVGA